jgi:hypothetical protein
MTAYFTFLAFKILTLLLSYVDVMIASCKLEISLAMPSWGKLSTLHFLSFELISLSFVYGYSLTRVNSANVLDEGHRIGGRAMTRDSGIEIGTRCT